MPDRMAFFSFTDNCWTIPDAHDLRYLAVTPDGKTIYLNETYFDHDTNPGLVYVINVQNPMNPILVKTLTGFHIPAGMAVNSAGTKVYVASDDNPLNSGVPYTVSVIDTATNTVTSPYNINAPTQAVAVSPDGNTVYATYDDFNGTPLYDKVAVINTVNHGVQAIALPLNTSYPYGVAVSPDGSKVYIALRYGNDNQNPYSAMLILPADDVNSPGSLINLPGVSNPNSYRYSHGVAVSPDGSKVFITIQAQGPAGAVSVTDANGNLLTATPIVFPNTNPQYELGNFVG